MWPKIQDRKDLDRLYLVFVCIFKEPWKRLTIRKDRVSSKDSIALIEAIIVKVITIKV